MSDLVDSLGNVLTEYDEGEAPVTAPEGVPIIRPFKELTSFWPNDQADREDVSWVMPYEVKYLKPFGNGVAKIFGVNLIDDAEYIALPEDVKATHLFTVLTRSEIREKHPGKFVWYPVCVVLKYVIMVAVEVMIDRANQKIDIMKMLLWSKSQQAYVPVFDEKAGKIENPAVLLQILEKYARMEGLDR
jgi:hypothetical protein